MGNSIRWVRWPLRLLALLLAGIALQGCRAPSCSHHWVGPAGGAFGVPANWDVNTAPTASSTPCAPSGSSIVVDGVRSVGKITSQGSISIPAGSRLDIGSAGSSTIDELDVSGGTLGGTGSLTMTAGTWTGGTITIDGTLTIGGSAVVQGDVAVATAVANNGTVTIDGGATLDVDGLSTPTGTFAMEGAGATLRFAGGAVPVDLSGVTLRGAGTVANSVTGSPTLDPEAARGVFTIAGDWTSSAGSTLKTAVAGLAPNGHDELHVGGRANPSGAAIEAGLDPAYTPTTGDSFTLLSAGTSVDSTFATATLPSVAGHGVYLSHAPTAVNLWVTDCDPAVLHPGAALTGANLANKFLRGCDLGNAVLTNANLTNVNFTDANLRTASMNSAVLTGVVWSNTTCPDGTNSDANGGTCVGHLPLFLYANSHSDLTDTNPGDGMCLTTTAGKCSIRAAIQEANAHPGFDVIDMQPGSNAQLTIAGVGENAAATGDLDITDDLQINGNGATLDANSIDKGFQILNGAHVVADNVTVFKANGSGGAAGFDNVNGVLTLTNISITSTNVGVLSASTTTVTSSTVSGAANAGIWTTAGSMSISETTVSASGASNGAIFSAGGTTSILDSTVTLSTGFGLRRTAGTMTVQNSIDANQAPGKFDCSGAITSLGYNLVTDSTCGFGATGDTQTPDAKLNVLAVWAGIAKTHLPQQGSPAIDTGMPGCASTDERGMPRSTDGDGDGVARCDRGAVEASAWRSMRIAVNATVDKVDAHPGDGVCETSTPGECTLRAAVQESNTSNGPDVIALVPGATYDLTIRGTAEDASATGDLDIAGAVSFLGNSSTVTDSWDGDFDLLGADAVSLSEITIDRSYVGWSIYNRSAVVTLQKVVVDNVSNGIQNDAQMTVVDSELDRQVRSTGTFNATRSTMAEGLFVSGTVSLTRSTVSHVLYVTSAATNIVIVESTLYGTDSSFGGTITTTAGASITVTRSIVDSFNRIMPACTAPVISGGSNLAPDASCALTGSADIQNLDPRLGPLTTNGGPTRTMRPVTTSPAIDSGASCSAVDQRGAVAPQDGDGVGGASCDRGAVEVGAWNPLNLTVTTTADHADANPGDGICATSTPGECTFRAAIQEANAATGPDTVTLIPGTYALTVSGPYEDNAAAGDVDVQTGLVLHGAGATIDGTGPAINYEYAMQIAEAPVSIDHLTVVNGSGIDDVRGSLSLTNVGATLRTSGPVDTSDSSIGGSFAGGGTIRRSSVAAYSSFAGPFDVDQSAFASATNISFSGGPTTIQRSTSSGGTAFLLYGQISFVDSTLVATSIKPQTGSSVTLTSSVLDSDAACTVAVSSGGYNLARDSSCGLAAVGDLQGVDPMLSPLAPHGGAFPTFLPLTGSPAIDSGRPGCTGDDGRDSPRPVDGDGDASSACDRGAVEVASWNPLSFTVNSTADAVDANPGDGTCGTATPGQCTLRAAIQEANANTGPDTITLAPSAVYTLTRSGVDDDAGNGDLDVLTALVLHGAGATIDANKLDGGLDIFDTTASLDNLSITGAPTGAWAVRNIGSIDVAGLTLPNAGNTSGGGILSWRQNAAPGALRLSDSTVTGVGNPVEIDGQGTVDRVLFENGAFLAGTAPGATVTVTSSTFIANGKGYYQLIEVGGGTVDVVDSTVVGDQSAAPFRVLGGTATATNSIILSSVSGACAGPVTSGGYNITSDATCSFGAVGDLVNADPLLFTLSNQGGSTRVLLPLAGSPAIDSGRPGCTGLDQRGYARPRDGDGNGVATCDRGAVELTAWNPLHLSVTSTADAADAIPGDGICQTVNAGECTLRAAIQEANRSTGPDVVTLQGATTYALTLAGLGDDVAATGDVDVFSPMALQGNGSTIDGTGLGDRAFQVFRVPATFDSLSFTHVSSVLDGQNASVGITNVIMTGGTSLATSTAGSLTIADTATSGLAGTGVSATGTTSISRSTITGGGLCALFFGPTTISASLFSGCINGIAFGGSTPFAATIANSTVSQTSTISNGYGINGGVNAVTIVSSTLTGSRGFELVLSGTSRVTNSIIANRFGYGNSCSQAIPSGGYNLVSDASCSFAATGDLQSTAANLGPLAWNGGPTQTHLPNAGSPAIDSGDPACTGTDQRGVARPQGAGCDRGSVEQ